MMRLIFYRGYNTRIDFLLEQNSRSILGDINDETDFMRDIIGGDIKEALNLAVLRAFDG